MSGFTGPYALAKWSKSTIKQGTTDMSEVEGSPSSAQFSYEVDLGRSGSGVSLRTATFKTKVPAAGKITFAYEFKFFHAWYQVEAVFRVFACKDGCDQTQTFTFTNWGSTGERTVQGVITIDVQKGGEFGFEIGGSNFDSTSRLIGTLTVSDFQAPLPRSSKRKRPDQSSKPEE